MTRASSGAPRRERSFLGYRMVRAVVRPPLLAAVRLEVRGAAHVPASGGVILAANHRSFADSVILAAALSRPISFLAKAEYFENRVAARLLSGLGQIPLRRGSPAGAAAAMDAALSALVQGRVVGVYPEGTRSRDGQLGRGHLGPARLAAASGAPLVPVGLRGTETVQAPGDVVPHLGRSVEVVFAEPLSLDSHTRGDRRQLRVVTDELMVRIGSLSGQVSASAAGVDPGAARRDSGHGASET